MFKIYSFFNQAPYIPRITLQLEIQEVISQPAELIRSLGKDINDMKQSLETSPLKGFTAQLNNSNAQQTCGYYLLIPHYELPDNISKLLPNFVMSNHLLKMMSQTNWQSWKEIA